MDKGDWKVIKDIKAKWVEALRSGKYKQGAAALKRVWSEENEENVEYCCLGVLCELAVEDGVLGPAEQKDNSYSRYYNEERSELPDAVMVWADIPQANPVFEIDVHGTRRDAICLNDGGWTFEQIADIIENSKI